MLDKEFIDLVYKVTFCENLEVPSALYKELSIFLRRFLKEAQLPKQLRDELEFLSKATKLASTIKDKQKLLVYIQTNKAELKDKAKYYITNCKLSLKQRDNLLKQIQEYLDIYLLLYHIDEISGELHNLTNRQIKDVREVLDRLKTIQQKISYEVLTKFSRDEKEVVLSTETAAYEVRKFSQDLQSKFILPGFNALKDFKLLGVGLTIIAGPTNHGKTTLISGIAAETFKGLSEALKLLDKILEEKPDIPMDELEQKILTDYNGTYLYEYWPVIKTNFDVITDEGKKFGITFISLEEDEISIFARVLSNLLDIPRDELKKLTSEEIVGIFSQYLHPKVELRIKYMPSLTKVSDVELYLANLESSNIRPILTIVDYMDKLQSPIHSDNYRLNLLTIAYALRDIAVLRNLCMLTATQLNRDSLKQDKKLDLDNVAEAFAKTWEADCVCLFRQKESYPESGQALVEFLLAKSRYTMRGKYKELLVDLGRCKIVEPTTSVLQNGNESNLQVNAHQNENHVSLFEENDDELF